MHRFVIQKILGAGTSTDATDDDVAWVSTMNERAGDDNVFCMVMHRNGDQKYFIVRGGKLISFPGLVMTTRGRDSTGRFVVEDDFDSDAHRQLDSALDAMTKADIEPCKGNLEPCESSSLAIVQPTDHTCADADSEAEQCLKRLIDKFPGSIDLCLSLIHI